MCRTVPGALCLSVGATPHAQKRVYVHVSSCVFQKRFFLSPPFHPRFPATAREPNGTTYGSRRLAAPYHRPPCPPAEHGTTSGAAPSASHDPNASVDPELLATVQITKATYLEDAPAEGGTTAAPGVASRERVVAVEFDPVVSLTRAFRAGCQPSSEAAIRRASVEVTLAGDGGPVRRNSMTVFTLTASSELLRSGRTPLLPVLFILGGEQAIHTAIGERLRTQLSAGTASDLCRAR